MSCRTGKAGVGGRATPTDLADPAGDSCCAKKVSDPARRQVSGLMQMTSEALLTIDKDLIVTGCNRGAELIFGYEAEDLIGRPIEQLMPERYRAPHRAHVAAFRVGDRASLVMSERSEIRGLRKDGSEFPAEASIAKSDVGGKPGFALVLRDITERHRIKSDLHRARQAAEQANLAKTQFLSTMSHELRTPLNAVIGFASVIENRQFGDDLDRYVGYAADIRRSGEHLLAMINEILDLSRIESGHGQLELELAQPAELIEESLALVRERAQRAGLAISVKIDPDVPATLLDRRRIKQVLVNLLTNAVKFTPEGGRIEVNASREQDGLLLVVTDSGIGIASEHMDRLFEPFHQIPEHRARNPEGIGLGLSIVNRICAQHRGRINVDSAEGRGTAVRVWLPLGGPGTEAQGAATPIPDSVAGSTQRAAR